jgi:hypothetical protein
MRFEKSRKSQISTTKSWLLVPGSWFHFLLSVNCYLLSEVEVLV